MERARTRCNFLSKQTSPYSCAESESASRTRVEDYKRKYHRKAETGRRQFIFTLYRLYSFPVLLSSDYSNQRDVGEHPRTSSAINHCCSSLCGPCKVLHTHTHNYGKVEQPTQSWRQRKEWEMARGGVSSEHSMWSNSCWSLKEAKWRSDTSLWPWPVCGRSVLVHHTRFQWWLASTWLLIPLGIEPVTCWSFWFLLWYRSMLVSADLILNKTSTDCQALIGHQRERDTPSGTVHTIIYFSISSVSYDVFVSCKKKKKNASQRFHMEEEHLIGDEPSRAGTGHWIIELETETDLHPPPSDKPFIIIVSVNLC